MHLSHNKLRCFLTFFSLLFSVALVIYALILSFLPANVTYPDSSGSRASPTLKFVVAISRHGNRGPLLDYPNNLYPSNDTTVWPYGVGELTHQGRVLMFSVGKIMRSLYDGYLNKKYYYYNFKGFSTTLDRTLMSGEELLAGLFRPIGFQLWNKDVLWQPVPIFPTFVDHSELVAPSDTDSCPRYHEAQKQSLMEFQKNYESNITYLIKYLNSYTGLINASNSFTLISTWESFFCAENEGLPLPEWARTVYPEPMSTVMSKYYEAYAIGSDIMIRLLQGLFFQEIVGLLQSKVNGTMDPDRQMYYYSGHDYSILGMQGILGLSESVGIIKTGSVLLFELHQDLQTNQSFIEVLYIDGGSPELEPIILNIPGCIYPCDLYNFLNITRKYYNITDYGKECQI